jgi:hypothetical protein
MSIRIPEQFVQSCKCSVLLLTIVMLMLATIMPCHADEKVVLIAAKGSGIDVISNRDIRRVFLGLKSADSEQVNKPVINLYNRDLYEEFLKNVMHMTEGTYKRKIVKRVFRNGAEEIKEVEALSELNSHLTSNVGDISFVESAAVEKMHDIEVVKVLW